MLRRTVIIGASSTLGFAAAQLLLNQKDHLWLSFRSAEKEPLLRSAFPHAQISQLDLADERSIPLFARAVGSEWSAVDSLVIAAGIGLLSPAHTQSQKQVSSTFQVNLQALVALTSAFYPLLIKGSEPSVVLFSSVMGLVGAAGLSAYSASKAGIAAFARSLAIEWAPKKIRVNAIAPGVIPSPMVNQMFAPLTSAQVEAIRARHPLGFGQPEDAAQAVEFLLSPRSRWITGIVLPVDGGYSAQ